MKEAILAVLLVVWLLALAAAWPVIRGPAPPPEVNLCRTCVCKCEGDCNGSAR